MKLVISGNRPQPAGRRYVSISAGGVPRDRVEWPVFGEQFNDLTNASTIRTGIAEIDRQHQQLLGTIDELAKYVDTDYSFAAFMTAETTLLDYTKYHFAFEEQLMAEWGFPDLGDHQQEHQRLVTEVEQLWNALEAGDNLGHQLLEMLKDWIIDHITDEIQLYHAFADALAFGQNPVEV